jgi:hypothetical protein
LGNCQCRHEPADPGSSNHDGSGSSHGPVYPQSGGYVVGQCAFGWTGSASAKRGVITKQGGAVGTDDLGGISHVKKHVRMIKGRQLTNAHELPGTYLDQGDARRVMKVRNNAFRHDSISFSNRESAAPAVSMPHLRLPAVEAAAAAFCGSYLP